MRPRQPQRILAARRRQTRSRAIVYKRSSHRPLTIDRESTAAGRHGCGSSRLPLLDRAAKDRQGDDESSQYEWHSARWDSLLDGTLLDGTAPSQKAPRLKVASKTIGRVVALDLTHSTGSVAGSRLGTDRGDDITQPYKPSQRG